MLYVEPSEDPRFYIREVQPTDKLGEVVKRVVINGYPRDTINLEPLDSSTNVCSGVLSILDALNKVLGNKVME